MGTQKYFEQALANFTFEAACGGAIRHLADQGFSIRQIREKLDYPVPYEQIQEAVFEHFCDSGTLLLREPEFHSVKTKPEFVLEHDQYGKASFRKITVPDTREKIIWKESRFSPSSTETFPAFLERKMAENGSCASYLSCDFGLWAPKRLTALSFLDSRQKDYLCGLPWPAARVYHRLVYPMKDIVKLLYQNLEYSGICYFLKTEEKVFL